MVRPRSAAAAVGLMILLAACSPSASSTATGGSSVPPASGGESGATTVGITLQDGVLTPDADSAPAGDVTFEISNEGTVEHEFLVIKTDLAPDELPTESDGSVDESSSDIEIVDEVEALEPGASESLTVNLEAGNYVLVCNMVSADFGSHYAAGMHAAFTVE